MTDATATPAFASLALAPELLDNLATLEYHTMTPIQAQSLPPMLQGRDVIAQGQTGSGKTAAFGLGLLSRKISEADSPTRAVPSLTEICGEIYRGRACKLVPALVEVGFRMAASLAPLLSVVFYFSSFLYFLRSSGSTPVALPA